MSATGRSVLQPVHKLGKPRVVAIFPHLGHPAIRIARGAFDPAAICLDEVPGLLAAGRLPIDVALLQVSTPASRGFVSLGVSVDLAPSVIAVARHVFAEINSAMPRTHGESFVHLDRFDALVRALLETPLPSVGMGPRAREGAWAMSDFKGRHFEGEIVLWAVRWYCRYGVSYRDLEQMMGERGVSVDHSTIYRWVQRYAPEIEKRLRWQWRGPRSTSWRIDETYVKVRGQWAYLYRAVDKHGNTIDFYLSPTRNTAPTYAAALAELKKEGKCPEETLHRQIKYLNNIIEADHGKLKQLIRPVRGFKTLKTA